jgi:cytochrome c-type biogenesis protein CcmH
VNRRRFWVALFPLPLAAMPVTEKSYRWVGERLICQCGGCGYTVYGCNHYGCSSAEALRREVREALAVSDSEEAALQLIAQKHGPKILAEPPKSGFNLTAWIMPFAALLAGLFLVTVILRQWRQRHGAEAAGVAPVDPALLARYQAGIDQEIEKG